MGNLELSHPQHVFLNELNTKFRAYVGGLGSGKTYVGCLDLLLFAIKHPGTKQGYFGPSYPSIRDIFYPTIEEAAESIGVNVTIKLADKEVILRRNGENIGTIICRSMDRPASIIGFKIARALVDEIDTMALDKATEAWRKIIARMRLKIPGVVNGIGVTCTPEGFLFVYNHFAKNPTKLYSMVQASTFENEEYLPDDYIESLYETYPDQLVSAYVLGQFVNLTSGSVYSSFDRQKNHYSYTERNTKILMGNDFNVMHTCGILAQMENGVLRVYKEYVDMYDTPELVNVIQKDYPHKPLMLSFPDASGKNRHSSDASASDHATIRKVAQLRVNKSNPAIKDRYMAVNKALDDGLLTIDVKKCPELAEALEQQSFDKNGLPDKSSGVDHPIDGLGYLVYWYFPISKPKARLSMNIG